MLELGYNDLIQGYLENHQVSHSTAKSQITKKKKKSANNSFNNNKKET